MPGRDPSGNNKIERNLPWVVGRSYRLRQRQDEPDLLLGIDPDQVVSGSRQGLPAIFGKGKIYKIIEPSLPPPIGTQTIYLQVNDMMGDDGKPLLLVTAANDLRIPRTRWLLTSEEIPDERVGDPADPNSYVGIPRSRYFIKSGTLHELDDENSRDFIKRVLTRYENSYRWSRGGLGFGPYFSDAKFISESDAVLFEQALRQRLRTEISSRKRQ